MPNTPTAAKRAAAPAKKRGPMLYRQVPRRRANELLKTREAAAYLKIGVTKLRELIAAGEIHPMRLGGELRFDPDDLERVVR
jgi:excisionase family DNA binding protein